MTILSGTYSQSYVYTFPDATAESVINAFAQQKKAEQDAWKVQQEQAGLTLTTVSFEHTGRTVSMTQAYEKTAEQLEKQNQRGSVSGMNSGIPKDAVIKSNSSRTEYKITYTIPPDPDFEDDTGRDMVLTLKKV